MSRTNAATLFSLGLLAAGFLVLGPAPIGGPATYVIVDGTSMEPTLVDGDLAVVRRSDAYRLGDVIAFRLPDGDPASRTLVIHRIVGGSAEGGFLTRGDNRSGEDPWRPRPNDIVGSVWLTLSGAGTYLVSLRNPLVLAPLAAGFTVFLVLLGGGNVSGARQDSQPPRPSRIGRFRRLLRRERLQPRSVGPPCVG